MHLMTCLPKPVFTLISVELAVNQLVIIFYLLLLWLDPFLHYHVTHVGRAQLLAFVHLPVASASSGGSATAARVLRV